MGTQKDVLSTSGPLRYPILWKPVELSPRTDQKAVKSGSRVLDVSTQFSGEWSGLCPLLQSEFPTASFGHTATLQLLL